MTKEIRNQMNVYVQSKQIVDIKENFDLFTFNFRKVTICQKKQTYMASINFLNILEYL